MDGRDWLALRLVFEVGRSGTRFHFDSLQFTSQQHEVKDITMSQSHLNERDMYDSIPSVMVAV